MANMERYLNQLITDKTALANNLVEKGVDASAEETFTELVPKIKTIQTVSEPVTKGIVVNGWDEDGFATDVSIVGLTELPRYYLGYSGYENGWLSKVGSNLHLPDNLTKISDYALYYCEKIGFGNLPNSVSEIGGYSFYRNKNLTMTKLPDELSVVGQYAFANSSLSVDELPEHLTTLSNYAFQSCSGLKASKLPKYIYSVGSSCFYGCSNITFDKIELGNVKGTTVSLGESMFQSCKKITPSELGLNISGMGNYCFRYCEGIEKMTIKGIQYLTTYGFGNCTNLKEVILKSNNMQDFREGCFSGCTNLTKVVVPNISSTCYMKTTAFTNTPIANGTGYIYLPASKVESFKNATNWTTLAAQILPIELESMHIKADKIYTQLNKVKIEIVYNDCLEATALEEQAGYVLSVDGNASVDGYYIVLTDNAKPGDIITVTATSTYNPEIYVTKELIVTDEIPPVVINLNDGQWIDSGESYEGNTIYMSDAGSYGVSKGKSIATITVNNIKNLKICAYAGTSGSYDNSLELFDIDTPAVRGQGKYKLTHRNARIYTCFEYDLDGGTHTIDLMYSKNYSETQQNDRCYFYIESYE